MSTITKERVAQYANDPRMCNVNDEIRQIARIALASLEAEAVAWTDEQELRDVEKFGCAYLFTVNPITSNADPRRVIKLYAAPPAPVSVPDENGLLPCPCCGGNAEFDYDDDNLNWISCHVCGISTDTAYHTDVDARDKLRELWNHRAAMLQGKPNQD
ncbi:Lar family restriction alleviation protein [Enterobacter asburiae]|uniref:Lar family restriction alleviation protein n=1 Tax=Enterobacter asburiae TaxID=61645 RepID=UPI0021D1B9C7|nr:Lar family restriction alleviation protein [Enterobacter asburiae]MCU6240768.1 Lar family restriction alleviation protein [Enterobacter asburiae]